MATFKIIKTSDWTTKSGNKGQTLVVAASGRVFTANPADFPKGKTEKDTWTPGCVCEVIVDSYVDELGNNKRSLKLVPELGDDIKVAVI